MNKIDSKVVLVKKENDDYKAIVDIRGKITDPALLDYLRLEFKASNIHDKERKPKYITKIYCHKFKGRVYILIQYIWKKTEYFFEHERPDTSEFDTSKALEDRICNYVLCGYISPLLFEADDKFYKG